MGLFAPSPEEPTEWAGLPSEPLEPKSAAERLADSPVDGLGLVTRAGVGSISIPLTPPAVTTVSPDRDSDSASESAQA